MAIENVRQLINTLRYLRALTPTNGVFADYAQRQCWHSTAWEIDNCEDLADLRAPSDCAGGRIGVLDADWVTMQRSRLVLSTGRSSQEIDAMGLSEFAAELISNLRMAGAPLPAAALKKDVESNALAETTKVESKEVVPPEYRDGGLADGAPLTAEVCSRPEKYNLSGAYLSKNYCGPRLKLGKKFIYQHALAAALSDRKTRLVDAKYA